MKNDDRSKSQLINECVELRGKVAKLQDREARLMEAKEAVFESEELYRVLVELTPDAIIVHSGGRIVFTNPAGAQLLGARGSKQLIGKPIHDFLIFWKIDTNRKDKRRDVFNIEEKLRRLDGREIMVEVAASPFIYKGKPAVQAVLSDITEKSNAEEMRLENERLMYANKAKSEFLSSVSHDLRTHLNSIMGFSDLMKQKTAGELNQKQERYMSNVLISSKFLLELINNILDLSRIEAGKIELIIEKFEVNRAINEIAVLLKGKTSKHNIIFEKDFDPELEFIEGDKQRFKQIMFNLLGNAIKFSKEKGGTVTIRTRKNGDMAHFSVSDTGIGIRQKDLGRLFTNFQQLRPEISQKYGGTGLGLSITKQLVELHGGKIMVESKYGKGSTFTVLLPVSGKKPEEK
jgi:PAS domain S-box-containing protein